MSKVVREFFCRERTGVWRKWRKFKVMIFYNDETNKATFVIPRRKEKLTQEAFLKKYESCEMMYDFLEFMPWI